ncbi:Adenosine 3'-phospho 5'-phosphosulfate transporter 2 [Strongyloides ratti]|uniref:Adenosine 3'-phospho 5'-phosphosulfate transporter 2 n=1 Tax=Strongyloides ratti TaxID=34506 RepID=A0A090LBI3_STRRB|nr:Adenosine 3'-phospho 5'-phosphosulfate transporter 2 [Strongyloides ratti]CEF67126.1 Adenosine 3'-phospho 5'-phosphosulfate transporter 2 [Strongyloides ratti]
MLPQYKKENVYQVMFIGINMTYWPSYLQFIVLCGGVMFFYLIYAYVQEYMFKVDGMKNLGWYITLIQFYFYSMFSWIERKLKKEKGMKIPRKKYFEIAFYTVTTIGLSNAATGYLNYPTLVIFKCCKLIPVLIGGILIQKKRYGCLDVLAAFLMSLGLIVFFLGDTKVSPNFDPTGYIMICGALIADAIIGNVQEREMKIHGSSNSEVVFYSYTFGFFYILLYQIFTMEIYTSFIFLLDHPSQYILIVIFSTVGYLGINVVLTLVRTSGALMAVTVTTLRKAVTIVISFLFFTKPFTIYYIYGGLIVLFAIYLNLYSKNKNKWDPIIRRYMSSFIEIKNIYLKNKFGRNLPNALNV